MKTYLLIKFARYLKRKRNTQISPKDVKEVAEQGIREATCPVCNHYEIGHLHNKKRGEYKCSRCKNEWKVKR